MYENLAPQVQNFDTKMVWYYVIYYGKICNQTGAPKNRVSGRNVLHQQSKQ